MADEVRVSPTPIQRNLLDVAVELTKLYYKSRPVKDLEELKNVYSELYGKAVEEYQRR